MLLFGEVVRSSRQRHSSCSSHTRTHTPTRLPRPFGCATCRARGQAHHKLVVCVRGSTRKKRATRCVRISTSCCILLSIIMALSRPCGSEAAARRQRGGSEAAAASTKLLGGFGVTLSNKTLPRERLQQMVRSPYHSFFLQFRSPPCSFFTCPPPRSVPMWQRARHSWAQPSSRLVLGRRFVLQTALLLSRAHA